MANKKALSTQTLVNAYPPWANTRIDEQSLGYQFLNTVGNRIEDLRKQNIILGDNYFAPTSLISDIDVYYQVKLPGSFIFTKDDDDTSEYIFTPPTVSGIIGSNRYSIQIANGNNIEGFWYLPAPSRLSLDATISGQYLIASGYASSQPFDPIVMSGIVDVPNNLYVTMSGGRQYIRIDNNNITHRTIVQIEGETRNGLKVVEELPFITNETLKTFHEYRFIEEGGIRVYGPINPEDTFVQVVAAQFNSFDYENAFDLAVNINKEEMPLFWSLVPAPSLGINVLSLNKYDIDDIILRSEGFSTKSSILQQELLTSSGTSFNPIDLAVQFKSDNLWVVDSGNLYLYSSNLPYSDNKLLINKQYDAHSTIEPNSYYVVLNEQVQLDYVWRRPVQGMVRHRVSVQKPDGNKYSIEDGLEVPFHTGQSSWFYGEPIERTIRASDIFILNQRGSWIYKLEVEYTDGTSSVDERIITVVFQEARAEYNLIDLGIPNEIVGVDLDSEEKLWVLDASGIRYQIDRHYDLMLIDFSRKIIYLHEQYDQIRIIQ